MNPIAVLVEERTDDILGHHFSVEPVWGGVDRPNVGGWALPNLRIAERLARAIKAGVVHYDATVKTDVNGHTYVQASSRVLGRRANADLRRLGF